MSRTIQCQLDDGWRFTPVLFIALALACSSAPDISEGDSELVKTPSAQADQRVDSDEANQEVQEVRPESHIAEDNGFSATAGCEQLQQRASDVSVLADLLEEHLPEELRPLIENPEPHRLQLLVTEVVETQEGPCLVEHGFRVDAEYFYPASAIKTVAAIAALQDLEHQSFDAPLELSDVLWFHDADDFDDLEATDFSPTATNSVEDLIEQTLIISSNQGFNRLFDLAGHERLNQSMWEAGLDSLRMQHRMFSWRTIDQEKWAPRVSIEAENGNSGVDSSLQEVRPQRQSSLDLPPLDISGLEIGQSYLEFGTIHQEPMDFSTKNYLSLREHQQLMIALYHPALTDVHFEGLQSHRTLLTETMGRDPESFSDDLGDDVERRFKPALPGFAEVLPRQRLQYFNKGGRAYGFHVENAYVNDVEADRSLFLTAVVYVNENQRLNDDQYEYDELSFPFFHSLGEIVARQFLLPESPEATSESTH